MKWNVRPSAVEVCALSLEDDLLDSRAVLARPQNKPQKSLNHQLWPNLRQPPQKAPRTAAALSAAEWKQSQISLFRIDTFYLDS